MVIIFFVVGFGQVSDEAVSEQMELIENTIRRSAVQCYVVEGSYPESLEYLVDNYSLYYDKDGYTVHYNNHGGNLLPEIMVFYNGD